MDKTLKISNTRWNDDDDGIYECEQEQKERLEWDIKIVETILRINIAEIRVLSCCFNMTHQRMVLQEDIC
eukprot:403349884